MDSEDLDLDIDDQLPGAPKPGTALARIRSVSTALADAARRRRMASRRGSRLSSGGFEARRGAKIMRLALLSSFLLVVALPSIAAVIYFGFVAADQYVAEAEFTVSAGESPLRDGVESLSGVPMQLIIQDTQIIANFLNSRELVDELERRINLRQIYGSDRADFWARFRANAPVEKLVKYWERVSHASIKLQGGVVTFDARAFSPEDAKLVADTTLSLCEDLVNNLNARINRDAVDLAEREFQRATVELSQTLAAEEMERNASGILETKSSADVINGLLKELKSALLSMSGSYDTQLKYVNADAAQMKELKSRIDVMRQQVVKLEGQMTTAPGATAASDASPGESTIASAMARFGELDARQKAAEQLYEHAASGLEHARIASQFKLIYLKTFVRPSLPQEPQYPERGLDMFLVVIGSLAAWGLLVAIASAVRNNMA